MVLIRCFARIAQKKVINVVGGEATASVRQNILGQAVLAHQLHEPKVGRSDHVDCLDSQFQAI
jgi:hypothetical protein